MKFECINPATEERLDELEVWDNASVKNAVKQSRRAFADWSKTDISVRADILRKLDAELRKNKKSLATLISKEMGKPISESEGEVEATLGDMAWFLSEGKDALQGERMDLDGRDGHVTFEPLGVVGVITPWNFPLNNPFYKIMPALVAGNTVVWKPSELTSLVGIEISKMFKSIGLPEGVLSMVVGDASTGKALVSSKIDIVSFTGSTATGRDVMKRASKGLKKVVLELGGSDPFIVCSDADLDLTIKSAVRGRFFNCGQSCSADKRFYVEKEIFDEFIRRFREGAEALKVGNPLDVSTKIGPLVSRPQRTMLEQQVNDSIKAGAKALCGGRAPDGKGYFYMPTILTEVNQKMRVMKEETFGPVAPVMPVKSVKEAIRLANDSEYGLAATVWTKDQEKASEISRSLNSGTVWLNKTGAFYGKMPWGGIKNSGIGREFSKYGMLEFVNIKSTI